MGAVAIKLLLFRLLAGAAIVAFLLLSFCPPLIYICFLIFVATWAALETVSWDESSACKACLAFRSLEVEVDYGILTSRELDC